MRVLETKLVLLAKGLRLTSRAVRARPVQRSGGVVVMS
jgi:hypothetical protein